MEEQPAYTRSAEYYDFIYLQKAADMYDFTIKQVLSLSEELLGRQLKSVLDLGCGTGNHAIRLAKKGIHVTAVDLSEPQIKVARSKVKDEKLPVEFIASDMTNLPELDRKFDAGASFFSSFCYLLDDTSVLTFLRSMYDLIVDDGFLYFEFWNTLAIKPDSFHKFEAQRGNKRLIRFNTTFFDHETGIVTMPMHHLIFEEDHLIDEFIERHDLRTYTIPHLTSLVDQTPWKIHTIFGSTESMEMIDPAKDELRYHAVLVP